MREPQRLKISAAPGPLPDSTEVSALIREFAEPLLYADPAGPLDVETIRTSLLLAMMCWNLPVYEAVGDPLYTQGKRALSAISQEVPTVVASRLRKLVEQRKTKYAELPFLVLVEVTGETVKNAQIVAEARLPRQPTRA